MEVYKMERRLVIFFLVCSIVWGCAGGNLNLKRWGENYDEFMNQADALAEVLYKHSEFSSCYWKAALGNDANKLPAEALDILDEIERITKGKDVKDLTKCEKGRLLGSWQRFGALVSKDIIERVVPYMIKFL